MTTLSKTKLEHIVADIGGEIQYLTTLDNTGRRSNKIVIEYGVKDRKNVSSKM